MEKAKAVSWVAALVLAASSAPAFQGPLLLSRPPATTGGGESVTDLSRESFRLSEDNVEQKITYFAKDDAPISIGVLLDTSGSMRNKMRRSSQAAATFFQTANPQDEFFLIEFSDRPKLTVPFTNDPDQV